MRTIYHLPFTHTFIERIVHRLAGFADTQHTVDQPAGELLRGLRTGDILQLITLSPLSFVYLPLVSERSQILGVRGTLQSTNGVTH